MVTCWERADHLALVCDVKLCICHFPCGILGQVWYLIVSIPDLCPFHYIVPSNMHCPVFSFMILIENIVDRQRSNFIQFIHISFKDPRFISSEH